MNSVIEKEKRLTLALTKLKNLNYKNLSIKKNIENLDEQKNQLQIEKQELENQEKIEKQKQLNFSEKIDELNQETDILLSEIDEWQT